MPNRKTMDPRDRYDHSSHATTDKEPGDLNVTPSTAPEKPKSNKRPTMPSIRARLSPRH